MRLEGIECSKRLFTSSVALVTSRHNGITNVMSAEWSLRVSIEPYLVAVFVGIERGSHALIEKSGEFALNYCSDEQAELAHIAGNNSITDGIDKWSLGSFRTFAGRHVGAPLIEGCVSNLECAVVSSFRTGDHTAFIGKVLNAYCDAAKRPLIYRGGKYYRIGEQVAKR